MRGVPILLPATTTAAAVGAICGRYTEKVTKLLIVEKGVRVVEEEEEDEKEDLKEEIEGMIDIEETEDLDPDLILDCG